MNITVNIPALDRLCDLIESGKLSFAQSEAPVKAKKVKTAPEPAPVVEETPTPAAEEAPKVTTPEPAPVVEETPAAPAPAEAPTAEQAADLARAVVKLSSVSHLRNILDQHIGAGVRITEADKGRLPALVDALNAELNKLQA